MSDSTQLSEDSLIEYFGGLTYSMLHALENEYDSETIVILRDGSSVTVEEYIYASFT